MINSNLVKVVFRLFLIIVELNSTLCSEFRDLKNQNEALLQGKYEKKRSTEQQVISNLTPSNLRGAIEENNVGTILNSGNSPINQIATLGMINGSPLSSITGMSNVSNPLNQLGSLGSLSGMMNGSNSMDQLGSLGNMNGSNPIDQLGSLGNMYGMENGSKPMEQLGSLGNMYGMTNGSTPIDQLGSLGNITSPINGNYSLDQLAAAFGGSDPGQIMNVGNNNPINQATNFIQQIILQRQQALDEGSH